MQGWIDRFYGKIGSHKFAFTQLVRRDFTKKYKRSILGIFWSLIGPLFTFLVLNMIFGRFFGRAGDHYTIYLFTGVVVMSYYTQATNAGMSALGSNASIFSKVKVPKYLFVFSTITAASINFVLTLIIYFAFVLFEGLPVIWEYVFLVFPVGCLLMVIAGAALVLSVLNVFFKDIQYLYGLFLTVLTYCTPIFYKIDIMGIDERYFLINPLYLVINYIREIVIYARVPSWEYHIGCLFYAIAVLLLGIWVYKRYNRKILYYI